MNIFNRTLASHAAERRDRSGWQRLVNRLQGAWAGWRRRRAPTASTPSPAMQDPQGRLLATQHFLAEVFQGCWPRMSPRDRQLYRQLVRTTSLHTLVALRFENFDLMCRLLGEGVARAHQRQIDRWLPARR